MPASSTGSTVEREDVAEHARGRQAPVHRRRSALFSLRDGDALQATLQIGRFADDAECRRRRRSARRSLDHDRRRRAARAPHGRATACSSPPATASGSRCGSRTGTCSCSSTARGLRVRRGRSCARRWRSSRDERARRLRRSLLARSWCSPARGVREEGRSTPRRCAASSTRTDAARAPASSTPSQRRRRDGRRRRASSRTTSATSCSSSLDGKPGAEQVVSRRRASRCGSSTPALVDAFIDDAVLGEVDPTTERRRRRRCSTRSDAQRWVLDGRRRRRSVIDVRGRAPTTAGRRTRLRRPDRARATSRRRRPSDGRFVQYDPESLDPTYRAGRGPVPRAERGLGRHPLRRRASPPAAAVGGDVGRGSRSCPTCATSGRWRSTSRTARSSRVMEHIGVIARQLEDLAGLQEALVEATAPRRGARGVREQVDAAATSPRRSASSCSAGSTRSSTSAGATADPVPRRCARARGPRRRRRSRSSCRRRRHPRRPRGPPQPRPQAASRRRHGDARGAAAARGVAAGDRRRRSAAASRRARSSRWACGGAATTPGRRGRPFVALDGSPRVPDARVSSIEIADDFSTSRSTDEQLRREPTTLQSFSTVDGSTQPLRPARRASTSTSGSTATTLVWIAGIATSSSAEDGRVVYYVGDVVGVDDGALDLRGRHRAALADGVDATAARTATVAGDRDDRPRRSTRHRARAR